MKNSNIKGVVQRPLGILKNNSPMASESRKINTIATGSERMGGAANFTIEQTPKKNAEYHNQSNRVSLSNQKIKGQNGYLSQGASDAGSARLSNR